MKKLQNIIKNTDFIQTNTNKLTINENIPLVNEVFPSTKILFDSDWGFLNASWDGSGNIMPDNSWDEFSEHIIYAHPECPAVYEARFESEPISIPDELFSNINVNVQYKLPPETKIAPSVIELPDSDVEDRYKRGSYDNDTMYEDVIDPDYETTWSTVPVYAQKRWGQWSTFSHGLDYIFKDGIWQVPDIGDLTTRVFTAPIAPDDLYTEFETTTYEPHPEISEYYISSTIRRKRRANTINFGFPIIPSIILDDLFPNENSIGEPILAETWRGYKRVYIGYEWHWEYFEKKVYDPTNTFVEVPGWRRPIEYKTSFTLNEQVFASGDYPITEDYFEESDFELYGKVLSTTTNKYPINQHFHYTFQKIGINKYIIYGMVGVTILGPGNYKFPQHNDSYGYYYYRPGYNEWWNTGILPDSPNYKVQMKITVSLPTSKRIQTAYIRNKI
jgi:hypothetical protein